jgi:hypothetical protein
MLKTARIIGFITGLLTLAWQVIQIMNGKGENIFLVADIILGIFLIISSLVNETKNGSLYLLLAYTYSAGVFSVATFGNLTIGTYNFGAFTTTLGLVPSVIFMVLISKHILRKIA